MRVLLVNPWIHDFAAYDFWLKPLGLLYVARAMEWMGYEVHLVDLLNRHDPYLPRFVKVPKDKKYATGKFPSRVIEKPEILRFVPRKYKRYGAPPEFLEWRLREIGEVELVMVTSTLSYWYPGVWETIRFLKNATMFRSFWGEYTQDSFQNMRPEVEHWCFLSVILFSFHLFWKNSDSPRRRYRRTGSKFLIQCTNSTRG